MTKCGGGTGRKKACKTGSCTRCGKKKKVESQLDKQKQKVDNKISGTMARKSMLPCNPLHCILNRQVNDKINHCRKLVDQRFHNAESLYKMDLKSHYGCVNAIEFSEDGELLVSGGDDKRVLLWSVKKALEKNGSPVAMKGQHMSNIFCLGYNNSKTKIFSAGNDDQVIVHDLQTTECLNFFRHEKPVYGISVHPTNDNVFSSACDDGRVLIYDIRGSVRSPETVFCVAQHKSPFHSVMFNPNNPIMIATANAKEGVSMWDVRKPLKAVFKYGSEGPPQNCMNVRFNKEGTTLLALRRRLPPILYAADCAKPVCQFDHPGYFNSCTMKSCCFAGNNDEYILSGSDDFNLYMWKIPNDESVKAVDSAHMILRGHRSIVNQVRYNQTSCILASSGVEKIIKVWSPFALSEDCLGGLKRCNEKEEKQRRVYTHDEYIGLVLRSGQLMSHDYSHQSTDEDQRMMAFFDSLVQREIESWSSEDIPTPPNQSDPDNGSTDSDDAMSALTLYTAMDCFVRSALNPYSSPSSPEAPIESPNPITYLIANRRDQLVRLAARQSGDQAKNGTGTSQDPTTSTSGATTSTARRVSESDSETTDPENPAAKYLKKPLKVLKKTTQNWAFSPIRSARKNTSATTSRRTRLRRPSNMTKEDSDTEPDEPQQPNDTSYELDTAQPSTSSGVVSSTRRLRYSSVSTLAKNQKRCLSTSSSSEDEKSKASTVNGYKQRTAKSDSDNSTKEVKKRKSSRIKSKTSSLANQTCHENKNKRQKANNDVDNNNASTNSSSHRKGNRTPAKEAAGTHRNITEKDTSVTPSKNSRHPVTSDSGITSGISTTEKLNLRTRGGSSDREKSAKKVESCKRKIDVSKRSYRKRVMQRSSSSSDSSSD